MKLSYQRLKSKVKGFFKRASRQRATAAGTKELSLSLGSPAHTAELISINSSEGENTHEDFEALLDSDECNSSQRESHRNLQKAQSDVIHPEYQQIRHSNNVSNQAWQKNLKKLNKSLNCKYKRFRTVGEEFSTLENQSTRSSLPFSPRKRDISELNYLADVQSKRNSFNGMRDMPKQCKPGSFTDKLRIIDEMHN